MITYEGLETFPSFRVARGEVKMQFDADFGIVAIMHPYDIAQSLAENGSVFQGLAALEGFARKEIYLKAQRAIERIEQMHVDPEVGK